MAATASAPTDRMTELSAVLHELSALRADLVSDINLPQRRLAETHEWQRLSARNLLHYLALRRHDLRPLQRRLAPLGLSSLGRAEPHVMASINAVLLALHALTGEAVPEALTQPPAVEFSTGQRLLREHTHALLGPPTPGRDVRIMVTMPSEAADDPTLIHTLLQHGMNALRINCAYDDEATWQRMIDHLRRAQATLGLACQVVMDLGGPKLRTGPLATGPAVRKVRPRRDAYGHISAPARVWLTAQDNPQPAPADAAATLPLPADWLATLRPGERLKLTDARNASRRLTVVDVTPRGVWAEAHKTTYFAPGVRLRRARVDGVRPPAVPIAPFAGAEQTLTLRPGDRLIVTRDQTPGRPATYDSAGELLTPATIGCTLPAVFDDVQPGDAIWFDDGKIGGSVRRVSPTDVLVEITHARPRGERLRGDKGINLPDSPLRLAALTAKDRADLPFVARHADVVELSFANSADDVAALQAALTQLTDAAEPPAIVIKIETRRAFENLPEMLLTAMRAPRCGVMIARGDLAVECGFERLAEVQEEILWICEAAHVPVIWATQVLESLARDGLPSRAEITDAAMGHRAECVMLNKGPHMLSALRVLDGIMRRMAAHQTKKRPMLRALRLAQVVQDDA